MSFLDAFTAPFSNRSAINETTEAAERNRAGSGFGSIGGNISGAIGSTTLSQPQSSTWFFGGPAASIAAPSYPDRSAVEQASPERLYDDVAYGSGEVRYNRPADGLWDDASPRQWAETAAAVAGSVAQAFSAVKQTVVGGDPVPPPAPSAIERYLPLLAIGGVVLVAVMVLRR